MVFGCSDSSPSVLAFWCCRFGRKILDNVWITLCGVLTRCNGSCCRVELLGGGWSRPYPSVSMPWCGDMCTHVALVHASAVVLSTVPGRFSILLCP